MEAVKASKKKMGRPALSEQAVDDIFRRLEPYLEVGISLNKAIARSGLPRSTVYKLLEENQEFMDKIKTVQDSFCIVVNDIVATELKRISDRQDEDLGLSRDDRQFVQWIASNNKTMREFYGKEEEKPKAKEKGEVDYEKLQTPQCIATILQTYECYRQSMLDQGLVTEEELRGTTQPSPHVKDNELPEKSESR